MNVLHVSAFDGGLDFEVRTPVESGAGFAVTLTAIAGQPETLQRWVLELVTRNSVALVTDEVLGLEKVSIEGYWSELARHTDQSSL